MRVYLFALSLCLVAASSGCKSNSGNSQQSNAPAQSQQQAATGSTADAGAPAAQQNASPSTLAPGSTVAPGQTAATTTAGATSSVASNTDACALLTSDEIKSVQGEAITESKASASSDAGFSITQCFYRTPTFTKSVSLGVTRTGAGGQSIREFWHERFERASEEAERERERERGSKSEREREREREREKKGAAERKGGEEEEEEGAPPTPVKGVGDEAYWASSRVNGTMYVLKKDAIIRISIGGADDDATRLRKTKALAAKALARL